MSTLSWTVSLDGGVHRRPVWEAGRSSLRVFTISSSSSVPSRARWLARSAARPFTTTSSRTARSEEHTSELQSHSDLVCRLLLEKKKKLNHDRHIVQFAL